MSKEEALYVVRSLIEDGKLKATQQIRFTYYMGTRRCWNIHVDYRDRIVFDYETVEDGRILLDQILSNKIESFVVAFCHACGEIRDKNLF